jgi:hypothetical protein
MIQKLIDYFYRLPRSNIRQFNRFGGYFSYLRMTRNSKAMKKAAFRLPATQSYPDGLSIYFLTGHKYLFQTLYCIRSLTQVTSTRFNFILVDDGSINLAMTNIIESLLPGAEIIHKRLIDENLNKILPKHKFKNLHNKRAVYPHIKKLMDIHTLHRNDWKLVLDSDMLFWSEPSMMLEWLKHGDKPMYMVDCQNSYGYSKELMAKISGTKIVDRLNVGIIGLRSRSIDWQKLDDWIGILEEKEGTSYYLEQALTAMLIGSDDALVLSEEDYVVNPNETLVFNKIGTLHHYVDLSKKVYFNKAWKLISFRK